MSLWNSCSCAGFKPSRILEISLSNQHISVTRDTAELMLKQGAFIMLHKTVTL